MYLMLHTNWVARLANASGASTRWFRNIHLFRAGRHFDLGAKGKASTILSIIEFNDKLQIFLYCIVSKPVSWIGFFVFIYFFVMFKYIQPHINAHHTHHIHINTRMQANRNHRAPARIIRINLQFLMSF